MKKFRKFVKMDQKSLKAKLYWILKSKYKEVINGDGFLYAKGRADCPILLTAHMDTVHEKRVEQIDVFVNNGKTVISSPQGIGGDDRCGIWMIYKILTTTKYRPSILFCEDEEIGGVGSSKFAATAYIDDFKDLKYLVELDRANEDDAVYYNCGNEDFMTYIESIIGYKEAYGSFSDIGHLSPACDRASVNLSCGYYKQHTLQEYVIFEEMEATLEKVKVLLADSKDCEVYDYQEWHYKPTKTWAYGNRGYSDYWGSGRYSYWDDEDDGRSIWEFCVVDSDGKRDVHRYSARSMAEAVGKMMMEYSTLTWDSVYDYAQY